MHRNEMCKKANWFARIPDWAILSCVEKLPVIMVKIACPAVSAHSVTSSTLYSWISKNLIGDLQVEIGSNSITHSILHASAGFFYCSGFFSHSLAKNCVAFEYEL